MKELQKKGGIKMKKETIWKDNSNKPKSTGDSFHELESLIEKFNRDYKLFSEYNKSFSDLMNEVLKGESEKEFMIKTGLGIGMMYRLKNQISKEDIPNRCTIISVCIGYDLDIMMAQTLLHSLGLDFNCYNKRDYAYAFILTECRGKNIEECNEILKALGVQEKDLLGYRPRKSKKADTE